MELVTGRAGSPHITAQQDRQKHQGIWGDGAYILATGNQLEPEVQSSNKILIKDGALMFQGALFTVKVGTTDEITINNGNQGMQRKDLVVARYKYDSSRNIESAEWVVIQGTPAASNPVTPSGTSGDIQAGDSTVDCPVFIITLDGINVTGVDVVPEVIPDIPTLNAFLSELSETESVELRNNFNNLFGYAERRGKQVSITSVFAQNQWIYQDSNWVTIGTIPVSMRPKRQQNGIAVYGGNQSEVTGLRVTTNGDVQAYFRSGSGQYLNFSISYSLD
ncbi:MAG TPA: hypothetical protein H9959_12555 [Candidatus Mediterraneibacter ornithocaccae]|nr:hypothetical protein [Candidatus Mediterraneibacter ornithocaccae]